MNGRVLIVHAAAIMRMMVRDSLAAQGYEIVGQAQNGIEAVEQYRALLPDVVTIDMILPELDGVGAIRAIVAEFPRASIIVCTSVGEPAVIVAAMQAGAKAFVTKPFGPAKLVDSVDKVLGACTPAPAII
jgi:two-component system chemotaxis response regulator CheY